MCDDSVNKRGFHEENIAYLFSGQWLQYRDKKGFIVVLKLGKEKFIDILKDQHPNFNQSASNGVLVSLNENRYSKCTAFKICISILFIAFDNMKSSPFLDEIHWAVEYLKLATRNVLMFEPAKTARLFTSDAPSEREFCWCCNLESYETSQILYQLGYLKDSNAAAHSVDTDIS